MEASSCYSRETVVVGLLSLRGGRSARQAPVSTVNQRDPDVGTRLEHFKNSIFTIIAITRAATTVALTTEHGDTEGAAASSVPHYLGGESHAKTWMPGSSPGRAT